jgi:hypothetical protein
MFVLTRWDGDEGLQRGARTLRAMVDGLDAPDGRRCLQTTPLETVADLRFPSDPPVATLLRVVRRRDHAARMSEGVERELTVRAMAAPGTVRATLARAASGELSTCRIEFDFEDALWHFMDSPLRKEWAASAGGAEEIWALNLPRFSLQGVPDVPRKPVTSRSRSEQAGALALELCTQGQEEAMIRFEGRMSAQGAERVRVVVGSLLDQGCRELAFDIRGLDSLTEDAMQALLAIVAGVRRRGGRVRLIERDDRFRRATRGRYLQRSVRPPDRRGTG